MPRSTLRRYFRHGLFPQLMVFEAVARLGGVTRAAEALHLAQPTVSMQLKKLSATLDVRLFEQRGRKLVLTPAGEALREACAELAGCLEKLEASLAGLRSAGAATLRLAAEPEARALAAQLLALYCANHPGVQASLHIAERAQLLGRLAAEDDDVYLFELDIEGEPLGRRLSVVHARGRRIAREAAGFLRDALAGGQVAGASATGGASVSARPRLSVGCQPSSASITTKPKT
jgi:DNA-binding transcriptional LysR family regulator